ncbi:hypothetical protein TNCT_239031 [Trichonephila clavata]|uniref:Uncharacterized protein n=1 Tax=Trichonephila clavata TaxID=2740835 RepID=A0A8X6GK35_TRICU|nr:hypothetical protein TNCT_239031 [Trichonephila clavata]
MERKMSLICYKMLKTQEESCSILERAYLAKAFLSTLTDASKLVHLFMVDNMRKKRNSIPYRYSNGEEACKKMNINGKTKLDSSPNMPTDKIIAIDPTPQQIVEEEDKVQIQEDIQADSNVQLDIQNRNHLGPEYQNDYGLW